MRISVRNFGDDMTAKRNYMRRRSVKLFSNYSRRTLAQLLSVSSGVHPATNGDYSLAYRPNAFVPKIPWNPIRESEIESYFELGGDWQQSRSVAILGPTSKLLSFIDGAQLGKNSVHELNTELINGIAETIFELLQESCEFCGNSILIGLARNAPNMPTVSINRKLGRLVGLHVDYWDALPLTQRGRSMNRISLNIGPSSRKILLVPSVLEDMATDLADRAGLSADLPALPALYMNAFASEISVVGCELGPGAAYIVPTENILHDGSTLGQCQESRQIVFRGNISPIMTKVV